MKTKKNKKILVYACEGIEKLAFKSCLDPHNTHFVSLHQELELFLEVDFDMIILNLSYTSLTENTKTALKEFRSRYNTQIIILTALSSEEMQCVQLSFDALFLKPYQVCDVVTAIENVCSTAEKEKVIGQSKKIVS